MKFILIFMLTPQLISSLGSSANQWTGFYMTTASGMKGLSIYGTIWKSKVPHLSSVSQSKHCGRKSKPFSCVFIKDHPFSTYAKLSEKLTFLTPWHERIKWKEMLAFQKTLRLDDPFSSFFPLILSLFFQK